MKPYVLPIFLLASFNTSAQQQQTDFDSLVNAKQKESIGKPFPLFKTSLHNQIFTNQDIKGKVVFINFWFENCAPCIAGLDALNKLYQKLKTKEKFEFISFTYESPKTIQLLAKKYHMQYKIMSVTQQECYRLDQNNAFPTSIILDKNGIIQFISFGGTTDKAMAKKNTNRILSTGAEGIVVDQGGILCNKNMAGTKKIARVIIPGLFNTSNFYKNLFLIHPV